MTISLSRVMRVACALSACTLASCRLAAAATMQPAPPGDLEPIPPAPPAAAPAAAPAPSAPPAPPPPAAPAAPVPVAPAPVLPPGYVWIGAAQALPAPVLAIQPVVADSVDTTRRALNAVFIEFGGNGIVYSVNYERFISQDFSLRAGVGYLSLGSSEFDGGASASLTTVPLMANYLGIGRYNHRLELGAGVVLMSMSARTYDGLGSDFGSGFLAAATGCIGYRYAPLDGGFNFKAGFTPLLSSFGLLPLVGVSFGAVF
jgi:hypothetical protein